MKHVSFKVATAINLSLNEDLTIRVAGFAAKPWKPETKIHPPRYHLWLSFSKNVWGTNLQP